MPNYVTNRVVMTGEQSRIDELVRAVQFPDEGLGSVDFSKVIRMPPELDIPECTDTHDGFKLYSDFVEVYKIGLGNRPLDPMNIPARAENAFLNYRRGISDRVWTLGRAAYRNYEKYGFKTWLDWRNKMWNTNSEGRRFEPFDNNTFCFETAWSRASPIVEQLSRMFPDVTFQYSWADQDFGNNVGEVELKNGEQVYENIPAAFSKEAYEMAADIRGEDLLADRQMVFNEETGIYEHLSDEEIEDLTEGEISDSGETEQPQQSM
ncbi:MAG: hypothetical protein J6O50_02385 [Ruminiclostridium sp.]|nr:hypothetical protein [Ruminiclostridium sp.]